MAKLFLLENSLKDVGGHHFDYVALIAESGLREGFEVVIGANRQFSDPGKLRTRGPVHPVFHRTAYCPYSFTSGMRELVRSRLVDRCLADTRHLPAWRRGYQRLLQRRLAKFRIRWINQFAADCETFFKPYRLYENDHAFLITASELELLGLSRFLAANPRTLQVSWHIQMHFGLFQGRPPEYAEQRRVENLVRECFQAARAQTPYHQISFYATTLPLAEQFEQLRSGEFIALPYPVNPQFAQRSERSFSEKRTLRITCAGGVRREKGQASHLNRLANQIQERHLSTGTVKLVVQRRPGRWLRGPSLELDVEKSTSNSARAAVEFVDHPIADDEYRKLVTTSDVGLFLYDSRRYYARCAGVLNEFLAAGKPVIVPAGCWLSEQITEPNSYYADRLIKARGRGQAVPVHELEYCTRNVPLPGGVLSFDQLRHPFQFSYPVSSPLRAVALQFQWHWPHTSGTFCRIRAEMLGSDQQVVEQSEQIVGFRPSLQPSNAIFRLPPGACQIRFRLSNAYHDTTANIQNLFVHGLDGDDPLPIGSVGLIVADFTQLPAAVDELVEHYPHYWEGAREFSRHWNALHHPARTINGMLARAKAMRPAA